LSKAIFATTYQNTIIYKYLLLKLVVQKVLYSVRIKKQTNEKFN
jgi:hypothetical protein